VTTAQAHELVRSFDCAARGCREEAEVEGGLCRHCTKAARERAREGAAHAGKLETGALDLVGVILHERWPSSALSSWHDPAVDPAAR
jgi:hypothetical protein